MILSRRTIIAAVCCPPLLHLGIWIPTISAAPIDVLVTAIFLAIKYLSIAGTKIRALLTRLRTSRACDRHPLQKLHAQFSSAQYQTFYGSHVFESDLHHQQNLISPGRPEGNLAGGE